jgi:hypothetical protein
MVVVRCENCKNEHSGSYGAGRFCSKVCARGFSTKEKREQINTKVSGTLKGVKHPDRLSKEARQQQAEKVRQLWLRKLLDAEFSSLSLEAKKKRVVIEQNRKCARCGIDEWLGEPLTLQVDHGDGDTKNNTRENLRGLCPNCHSQTPTYCGRNHNGKGSVKVIDEILLSALLSSTSMSQALAKVGYPKTRRHFERCKRVLTEHNLAVSLNLSLSLRVEPATDNRMM